MMSEVRRQRVLEKTFETRAFAGMTIAWLSELLDNYSFSPDGDEIEIVESIDAFQTFPFESSTEGESHCAVVAIVTTKPAPKIEVTSGNAFVDGRAFKQWFVGDIAKWWKGDSFDESKFGLRNTQDVEIKWGVHKKGEKREKGWSSCSDWTAISILVSESGDFIVEFRTKYDHSQPKARLIKQGDYVIWREDVEHCWRAEQDSVILTVRWKGSSK